MPLDLAPFADTGLTALRLDSLIDEHEKRTLPALERLWAYYRNPMTPRHAPRSRSLRHYRLAQEEGLPPRLRTAPDRSTPADREVVVENDIAWRIDTLIDFVFSKPPRLVSTAPDPERRRLIERTLDTVWENSGGVALLQELGLLGSVYGSADLLLRTGDLFTRANPSIDDLRIEAVEPTRTIPLLDERDHRRLLAYIVRVVRRSNTPRRAEPAGLIERLSARFRAAAPAGAPGDAHQGETLEVLSASHRRVFEDGAIVLDESNPLGVVPIAHIQNTAQPFAWHGVSDVEPLIPLQDELNTRLSDRAHRVTLQSFNMFLAKGIEVSPGEGVAVGPGQVWITDNPGADIRAISADADSPSEDRHIEQVRDAMDKVSAVSPVAIGVIRARLGHLSSENALRITLMGVLSRTARKRLAYARGIAQVSALALHALDLAGVLRTSEHERAVRLEWPDPLPADERARLTAALMKRDLGVPTSALLHELGYAPTDPGIV